MNKCLRLKYKVQGHGAASAASWNRRNIRRTATTSRRVLPGSYFGDLSPDGNDFESLKNELVSDDKFSVSLPDLSGIQESAESFGHLPASLLTPLAALILVGLAAKAWTQTQTQTNTEASSSTGSGSGSGSETTEAEVEEVYEEDSRLDDMQKQVRFLSSQVEYLEESQAQILEEQLEETKVQVVYVNETKAQIKELQEALESTSAELEEVKGVVSDLKSMVEAKESESREDHEEAEEEEASFTVSAEAMRGKPPPSLPRVRASEGEEGRKSKSTEASTKT
eukprot:CAMPEP_0197483994 /NCGR_PEP_ID=MMETSP1309-20131121/57178_1 /TAXON_ID=464262 /ORGANISM="Genus nov. species nov., Strain RCC998" /LENGTH=280 /DNA_ID=CAMNT_0043026623 /DNA_START=206 /DNA_END=1048 /DNA_ORIENTATION=+